MSRSLSAWPLGAVSMTMRSGPRSCPVSSGSSTSMTAVSSSIPGGARSIRPCTTRRSWQASTPTLPDPPRTSRSNQRSIAAPYRWRAARNARAASISRTTRFDGPPWRGRGASATEPRAHRQASVPDRSTREAPGVRETRAQLLPLPPRRTSSCRRLPSRRRGAAAFPAYQFAAPRPWSASDGSAPSRDRVFSGSQAAARPTRFRRRLTSARVRPAALRRAPQPK